MKIILSIWLLIMSVNVSYANDWYFINSQDEFTGRVMPTMISSDTTVQFYCNIPESKSEIFFITNYKDYLGQGPFRDVEWVTNDMIRGKYSAVGPNYSVRFSLILSSKENIDKQYKNAGKYRMLTYDNDLDNMSKSWALINAMKHSNTIKFRTITDNGVYSVSPVVSLSGFTSVFNKFKNECNKIK